MAFRPIIDSIRPVNLADAFAKGQQIRAQRQQMQMADEQQKAAIERNKLRGEAFRAARDGDPSLLQEHFPDDFLKLQSEDRAAAGAQRQQATFEQGQSNALAKSTAGFQTHFAKALQANPEMLPQLVREKDRLVQSGRINDFDVERVGLAGPANAAALGLSDSQQMTTIGRQLQEAGLQPGTPAFEREMLKRFRKGGGTQINLGLGNQAAERKVRAERQNEIIEARQTLSTFDDIEQLATNEAGEVDYGQFLSVFPQLKTKALSGIDKLTGFVPKSQRPFLAKMQQFKAAVGKYRSEEFKRLLGSAQTDNEIRNLVDVVLSEDMGSAQFTAALSTLRRVTERTLSISEEVLREGFDVGTKEYKREFERREKPFRAQEKIRKLKARGLSPSEISAEMQKGGF